jgi:hypothetical protein
MDLKEWQRHVLSWNSVSSKYDAARAKDKIQKSIAAGTPTGNSQGFAGTGVSLELATLDRVRPIVRNRLK